MYHLRTKKGKYLCKNREFTKHVKFEYCLRHFPNHLYPLVEFETIDKAKKVFDSGILGVNGCIYSNETLIENLSSSKHKANVVKTDLLVSGEVINIENNSKAFIYLKSNRHGIFKINVSKNVLISNFDKFKSNIEINISARINLKNNKIFSSYFISFVNNLKEIA